MANIGPSDRAVRLWSGALLGPTALFTLASLLGLPHRLAPAFGVTALYCFATGLSRYSPLYQLLGVDTGATRN